MSQSNIRFYNTMREIMLLYDNMHNHDTCCCVLMYVVVKQKVELI